MEISKKVKEQFQAEYDVIGPCPDIDCKYFAYKNGEAKEFFTLEEAKEYSQFHEQVTNIDERVKWANKWTAIQDREDEAYKEALKKHFGLNEKDFSNIVQFSKSVRNTLGTDYDYDYEQHLSDILEIMKYKMGN